MSDLLLNVEDLSVSLGGKIVLEHVNLKIHKREIMSVVGPNGGGKTTLLKVIVGLIQDYQGSITFLGKKNKEIKGGQIGYVPQYDQADLKFPVSVSDVVMMGLLPGSGFIRKFSREQLKYTETVLDFLGVRELRDRPVGSLSGGQKQRVLIARALVGSPSLLVLDEPSTGLDVVSQEDFYNILQMLKSEKNMSILMVSHDIGVVSGFVDTIACLNKFIHFHGEADGTIPQSVFESTFGKHVQVLVHNKHCMTCQEGHSHD